MTRKRRHSHYFPPPAWRVAALYSIKIFSILYSASDSIAAASSCDRIVILFTYTRALEAFISKDFEKSTKLYNSILSCPLSKPLSASAHLGLGRNYQELALKEKSIQEYTLALRFDDSSLQAFTNRGLVQASLGRLNEAINDFNQAIRIDSTKHIALTNRGVAYATIGKFSIAIKDFDAAIEINSSFGEAYLNRGIIHELNGNLSLACSDWKNALRLRQFSAKSWIDLQCNK